MLRMSVPRCLFRSSKSLRCVSSTEHRSVGGNHLSGRLSGSTNSSKYPGKNPAVCNVMQQRRVTQRGDLTDIAGYRQRGFVVPWSDQRGPLLCFADYASSSSNTGPRLDTCLDLPSSSPSAVSAATTRPLVVLRADLLDPNELVKDNGLAFLWLAPGLVLRMPLEVFFDLGEHLLLPAGALFLFECSCMWNVSANMGPKASGDARKTRGFSIPRSVTSAYMSAAEAMLVRVTQKKRAERMVFLAATSFGSTFVAEFSASSAGVPPRLVTSILCLPACCTMDLLIIWTIEKLDVMMTKMRITVTRMYATAATCIVVCRRRVQ